MPITSDLPRDLHPGSAEFVAHVIAAPTNIAVFIGYTHPLKTDQNLSARHPDPRLHGLSAPVRRLCASAAFAIGLQPRDADHIVGDMAAAVSQFFLNGGRRPTSSHCKRDPNLAA